ncbi:unnamed protein product [Lupinus luteus]|uniref:Uncharacterized protein n=1 Tax=Lupinus luteus TaxID=3873 RepID=A0AAV1XBV4_LUPLU
MVYIEFRVEFNKDYIFNITVGDGGNHEKMAIAHTDEPGNCPKPSSAKGDYMGGLCPYNFTSDSTEGKLCWDR